MQFQGKQVSRKHTGRAAAESLLGGLAVCENCGYRMFTSAAGQGQHDRDPRHEDRVPLERGRRAACTVSADNASLSEFVRLHRFTESARTCRSSREEVMSEEQRIVQPEEQRGIVADVVAGVVGGASSGAVGAVVQQGMAKLGGGKGKDDKKH
jgi:hypothetical protein